MGVAPTGTIFKGFTFDGEYSKDYGVYITGSGVFNAPERDVEMFAIPGRNGAFSLDRGRFNNILVTYEAGVYADNAADFSEAVSDLRNFLTSRVGYCRLEDDYNDGEYREAVYKSGLEVTPEAVNTAGTFNIVFECKPQRWLKSGETEITVTSGDTVNNPTLFDASPVLHADGYGKINLGGQTITIENNPLGMIPLLSERQFYDISRDQSQSGAVTANRTPVFFDTALINDGDNIYIDQDTTTMTEIKFTGSGVNVTGITGTITSDGFGGTTTISTWLDSSNTVSFRVNIKPMTAPYYIGTPYSTSVEYQITVSNNGTPTTPLNFSTEIGFDGNGSITLKTKTDKPLPSILFTRSGFGPVYAFSSASATGGTMYIDLDIGESYTIINGNVVSTNNIVEIPAKLPTLPPGGTTITYPNTITQLKIAPRWWKL